MIVINKDRVVEWPVKVRFPVNGGQTEEQEFTLKHKLLTRTEIARIRNGELREEEVLALFKQKIVGWDERVVDQNNEIIPFSEENLEAVLENSYIANGIELAMFQAATGVAAAKNSGPGSAGSAAKAGPGTAKRAE